MTEPSDIHYRRMITRELDRSMLVEAGAGSGKTTSLVDRMLALIASGRASVERMAAVTFTRKAAAELKGRFQVDLEKSLREEGDQVRRGRYQEALSRIDLLFAGTIHSFCARLLRERPIEARLDPDFQELEENENILLQDQCWSEYLDRLHAEESELLRTVSELGITPSDLTWTYQNVAYYPEVEVARVRQERPEFTREKAQIKGFLGRAIDEVPEAVPEKGWDSLQALLRRVKRLRQFLDLDNDLNFIQILKVLDKSAPITQVRWPNRDAAKALKAEFDIIREEVIIPSLDRWCSYCHYFIMDLVIPAVSYFNEFRAKKSLMNFQDLLLKAAVLLRDHPEVRAYFQERFTHVLVDEFQDTDPIQAEVILYLTGEDLSQKSWRHLKVKPGALFVVGDPKQSIFRFRRADIDTYNEVKRIIDQSGGLIVPLTENFRSLPALCQWLNPIFRENVTEEAIRFQPAFEELSPYNRHTGGGIRRITVEKVTRDKQEEAARKDAERIADWIAGAFWKDEGSWISTDLEGAGLNLSGPGDVMILLRYKQHLPIYARELEARNIPFETTGGRAFKDSEEFGQLLNLLDAVAAPEDQVALVATLRGQFFGVSDDLLYRFRAAGGILSYLAPVDQCQDKEAQDTIGGALSEMRQFHRWARTKPPVAALSLIWDRLGILPLALSREMGESRAGNLLKALELALWEASENLTSFADMVTRLYEYFSEIEVEEMSVEPSKKNAVRIMNLHKAKGLEAEVVFLADPLKDPDHQPYLHIGRTGESATGHFVAYKVSGYKREVLGLPPDWHSWEELEQRYQQAEEERLLYVATTRAKQLLVVSTYPWKTNKGAWKDLYPHLDEVKEMVAPGKELIGKPRGDIPAEALEATKSEMAARLSKCKRSTYEVESVTAAAKARAGDLPFSADSDQGMSWGRIVHRLLEAVAKDATVSLGPLTRSLLVEEDRPLSELDSIVSLIKSVMDSELWGRLQQAEMRLVEVPFSLKTDGDTPKIVTGVIDLAFKEPDGWVIADYKTDKVDGNLDSLVAYYRPQVEMYKAFWEEMSGEHVKEAGLFFIDPGKWVPL